MGLEIIKEAVSVVIPTFKRIDKLYLTLTKLYACVPLPAEVIVHIDHGDFESEKFLIEHFPEVSILLSQTSVGPGGGRNVGIRHASNNYIASFDDDSFPIDKNYFATLTRYFSIFPDAVILESTIYHLGEKVVEPEKRCFEQFNFTGCGSAYRKDLFLDLGGFIPKPIAYGIEEVDFSIRALEKKTKIIKCEELRVLHNTKLQHHARSEITSGSISNLALLVYLRYPYQFYYYGILQLLNRIGWLIRHRRHEGILKGLIDIPEAIRDYKTYRRTVSKKVLRQFLKLRTQKIEIPLNMIFGIEQKSELKT